MKVFFDTFGCRLNRAEALEDEARFLSAGFDTAQSHSDADVIVIRACSITRRAQHDCEKLISHVQKKYPAKRLIVQGCLPETMLTSAAIKESLLKNASESDTLPQRTARAYLKVKDGCNSKCTFCIVPSFRGKSKSVEFGKVLDKAKRFIELGYEEIVLTGCNLSHYASNDGNFASLLESLLSLPGKCRFRIGSLEPGSVALAVAKLMAQSDALCKFLHLSIQSGSTSILSAMGRKYKPADIEELVSFAAENIHPLGLGADVICGFPGESILDFSQTKRLLSRYPFSNIHAFPYSERPGTVASTLPGALPRDLRKKRALELIDMGSTNKTKFAASMIGRTVDVIIEDEKELSGWTGEYLFLKSEIANRLGAVRKKTIPFKVTKSDRGTLFGIPLAENGR